MDIGRMIDRKYELEDEAKVKDARITTLESQLAEAERTIADLKKLYGAACLDASEAMRDRDGWFKRAGIHEAEAARLRRAVKWMANQAGKTHWVDVWPEWDVEKFCQLAGEE